MPRREQMSTAARSQSASVQSFLVAADAYLARIQVERRVYARIDERELGQRIACWIVTEPPERGYSRTILQSDTEGRFCLAGIRWAPGAVTPVHAHRTWCCFSVLEGRLVQRRFAMARNADPSIQLIGTDVLGPDTPCSDEPYSGIHQLRNDSQEDVLSLHLYGVPADRAATDVNHVLRVKDVD